MTRGSNERPTRRLMASQRFGDEYVVELRAELILIRPKGSRRGGKSEVAVFPGAIYQRQLMAQVDADKRAKRAMKRKGR